jgi:C4-dicarboxylate transporter, DctM subunit
MKVSMEFPSLWLSLIELCHIGGTLVLAIVVGLVNYDIVARNLFLHPFLGLEEIVSLGIPIIVFLSTPMQVLSRSLISTDFLVERAMREFRLGLHSYSDYLMLLVSGAVFLSVVPLFRYAVKYDQFIGVVGVFKADVWPMKLAILIGFGLVFVTTLFHLLRRISSNISPVFFVSFCLFILTPMPFYFLSGSASIGLGAIFLLFVFLFVGVPVVFALMASASVGIAVMKGDLLVAANSLGLVVNSAATSYVLAAVPFFILMGLVVGKANIGRDSLAVAHWLFRSVTGGLGVATVAANTVFAAITGISIASAAIFSRVAAPPMMELGFTARFSLGLIAGSSVLGMLIPPSLLLIIYGVIAEVSIDKLFLAAILPGLILALMLCSIVVSCVFFRLPFAVTPTYSDSPPKTEKKSTMLRMILPTLILLLVVIGGIYGGIFTPTEAGAVGALMAILIAICMQRIAFFELYHLTKEAAGKTASILLMVIAATSFGLMITLSGIPDIMSSIASNYGLGLTGYVFAYLVALVLLGMVLDSTSILLIMVPLALPTVVILGGDLVWFGIVTVIGVEVGLLTPPLGLSVFAIKVSIDDPSISLNDIFYGAMPFALTTFLLAVGLILFPQISSQLF